MEGRAPSRPSALVNDFGHDGAWPSNRSLSTHPKTIWDFVVRDFVGAVFNRDSLVSRSRMESAPQAF